MGDIRNRAKIWPAKLAPIRISQELKDALTSEAEHLGVTESDVVRAWLEDGRKAAARRAARGSAPMPTSDPN
jgi:hypothetical protein